MLKKFSILFTLFCVIVLFSFNENNKYFEIAKNLDIFATLFKEVNTYYVDEINPEKLVKSGIDAMLHSLDPYTTYIPEDEIESFRTVTTGQYAGIGALIGLIDSKVRITRLYQGFAAHRNGLRVGDEIISINGEEINSENIADVSKLLKGQLKSSVNVTIERYGETKPLKFEIVREKITIGNVPFYSMVTPETGYIKLEDFAMGAGKEVKDAVNTLVQKGAESLILDLRGNPGGLLSEAVNVSNIFIPKGSVVVSTKGRIEDWNSTYKALNNPVNTNIPLVILIDNNSASAAEIVSGVIQDYDRGVLIGKRTFGKGLVQTTRPLSYNSQLKVTTAKYYIPSGRCIQSIDYSNKDESGNAYSVSDSLRLKFKTEAGREVYDGSGLMPDIISEKTPFAPITITLANKGHLFNYADIFFHKHQTIDNAGNFTFPPSEYENFKKWVKNKHYHYTTSAEKNIAYLEENAKKEGFYKSIAKELASLKDNIQKQKADDLDIFKDEIQQLLTREIAGRYFLYQGEIESSFQYDEDVRLGVNILQQPTEYKKILQK